MAISEEVPPLRGSELDDVLQSVAGEGVLEARDKRIDDDILELILTQAGRSPRRPARFKSFDVNGAVFEGEARFGSVVFEGDADFRNVTFESFADFGHAKFEGEAHFDESTFEQEAYFAGARLDDDSLFMDVRFQKEAYFEDAVFSGDTWFSSSVFSGDASFGAYDRMHNTMRWTTFAANASFNQARFESRATFSALVGEQLTFRRAQFEQINLGPMLVLDSLDLRDADFARRAKIEASARRMALNRVEFRDGADILVRWAEIAAPDSDFGQPTLVSERPARPPDDDDGTRGDVLGREELRDDGSWSCPVNVRDEPRQAPPRVVSLRNARVANLVVGRVDLRACLFEGAHRLDGMRIESGLFASSPAARRWTARRTLAEEHHWRAEASERKRAEWYPRECRSPDWIEPPATLDPAVIATIYRGLRKGFEDRKDEPGAADFYYGEMEMRRHAATVVREAARATRDHGERLVLTLYWLVSGYGLRSSRAFAALAVTVAAFATLLYLVGLEQRNVGDALVQGIEGATLRSGDRDLLTSGGQALQVALRLLGPLFLGLALVSLRGRVKR